MMFTLVKLNLIFLFVNMNILGTQYLTAVTETCWKETVFVAEISPWL